MGLLRRAATLLSCALVASCVGLYRAPSPDQVAAAEPTPDRPAGDDSPKPPAVMHRVEPGETLWGIGRQYAVEPAAIARANALADPDHIDIGQVLRILLPASETGAVAVASETPSTEADPRRSPEPLIGETLLWPVPGGSVLSLFGEPRPGRTHTGLDIGGLAGQEILAAGDGVVLYSGERRGGYGKTVLLDHGEGLQTLYAHGSALLVAKGDQVRQGQPIARVGRSGNATTDHCHFEVRRSDAPVDPMSYLGPATARTARR